MSLILNEDMWKKINPYNLPKNFLEPDIYEFHEGDPARNIFLKNPEFTPYQILGLAIRNAADNPLDPVHDFYYRKRKLKKVAKEIAIDVFVASMRDNMNNENPFEQGRIIVETIEAYLDNLP